MDTLGLNRRELRIYHRALLQDHERKIRVAVLDLDGKPRTNLNARLLEGQVDVSRVEGSSTGGDEVSRVLTAQLLDPGHRLNLDSDSPGDGALFADRMLRILDSRWIEPLDRWVTAVPFTGPIVQFKRTGGVVEVAAHSKERLALGELWRPLTLKKGMGKIDAIRTLMDATGETGMILPGPAGARLPRTRSLGRTARAWPVAQQIARSMDRQLYYTGRGRLRMRELPETVSLTFNPADGLRPGELLSDPEITWDMAEFRNAVVVVGAKPKGAKTRVRATAVAPRTHPLSPWRLGRNGQPLYRVEEIRDDNIRSPREAQQRAERVLKNRLRQVADVQFESMILPHLDPGDLARVHLGDGSLTFRLDRFSIPLSDTGAMTVGFHRRLTRPKRKAIR